MYPIEHLLQEHRDIRAQIADLRAATCDLAMRGAAALPDALPVLRRIGQMMQTQLALHAKKEDEALFPAIEAVLGTDGSPTVVMRQEHDDIHARGAMMRQVLHQLSMMEHPAIETEAEKLHLLSVNGGSAATLRATAEEIIELLDAHFGKEEQMLFPMAENVLGAETLAEVCQKMEALDRSKGQPE